MKVDNDTKEYLIRKIKTIQSKIKNLSSKKVSDFANEWEYEKWYKKQHRTIDSMKIVLENMLNSLKGEK